MNCARGSEKCQGDGFSKVGSMRLLTESFYSWLATAPIEPNPFSVSSNPENLACGSCLKFFIKVSHEIDGPARRQARTKKSNNMTFSRTAVRVGAKPFAPAPEISKDLSGASSINSKETQVHSKYASTAAARLDRVNGKFQNTLFVQRRKGLITPTQVNPVPLSDGAIAGDCGTKCVLCTEAYELASISGTRTRMNPDIQQSRLKAVRPFTAGTSNLQIEKVKDEFIKARKRSGENLRDSTVLSLLYPLTDVTLDKTLGPLSESAAVGTEVPGDKPKTSVKVCNSHYMSLHHCISKLENVCCSICGKETPMAESRPPPSLPTALGVVGFAETLYACRTSRLTKMTGSHIPTPRKGPSQSGEVRYEGSEEEDGCLEDEDAISGDLFRNPLNTEDDLESEDWSELLSTNEPSEEYFMAGAEEEEEAIALKIVSDWGRMCSPSKQFCSRKLQPHQLGTDTRTTFPEDKSQAAPSVSSDTILLDICLEVERELTGEGKVGAVEWATPLYQNYVDRCDTVQIHPRSRETFLRRVEDNSSVLVFKGMKLKGRGAMLCTVATRKALLVLGIEVMGQQSDADEQNLINIVRGDWSKPETQARFLNADTSNVDEMILGAISVFFEALKRIPLSYYTRVRTQMESREDKRLRNALLREKQGDLNLLPLPYGNGLGATVQTLLDIGGGRRWRKALKILFIFETVVRGPRPAAIGPVTWLYSFFVELKGGKQTLVVGSALGLTVGYESFRRWKVSLRKKKEAASFAARVRQDSPAIIRYDNVDGELTKNKLKSLRGAVGWHMKAIMSLQRVDGRLLPLRCRFGYRKLSQAVYPTPKSLLHRAGRAQESFLNLCFGLCDKYALNLTS